MFLNLYMTFLVVGYVLSFYFVLQFIFLTSYFNFVINKIVYNYIFLNLYITVLVFLNPNLIPNSNSFDFKIKFKFKSKI